MRLPLERWDALTKHANPHDRAWQNGDVRELVVLCLKLAGHVQAATEKLMDDAEHAAQSRDFGDQHWACGVTDAVNEVQGTLRNIAPLSERAAWIAALHHSAKLVRESKDLP